MAPVKLYAWNGHALDRYFVMGLFSTMLYAGWSIFITFRKFGDRNVNICSRMMRFNTDVEQYKNV